MKTPLALLHGYAMTLLEQDLPEEQRRWFLQVIADQSLELSHALDRLEEARQLRHAPEGERADVGDALREAVERARKRAPGLEVSLPEGAGPVVAVEHGWLVRAFEEVLFGSVPQRETKARVQVRVDPSTLDVKVTFRIDGKARLAVLGLYLARRVAEHFGGAYRAETGRIEIKLPADHG